MRTIDVDALKKDLNMADNCDECPINWKECEYGTLYSKKDFCQWLDDAPTIEPERQKGEWVGADSQCGIGCPFCGTPVDDFCHSIDYIDLDYEPNFCPNCGADLRKGKQNDTD